jgi:hypothetical protein
MWITVQAHPQAAAALHGRETPDSQIEQLRRQLEELGLSLAAMHPGETDPLLAPYFTVEVPDDPELAARVLAILEGSEAIEAAYVKPPEEPALERS